MGKSKIKSSVVRKHAAAAASAVVDDWGPEEEGLERLDAVVVSHPSSLRHKIIEFIAHKDVDSTWID